MDEELQKSVETLIKKSAESTEGTEAKYFADSALSVAKASEILSSFTPGPPRKTIGWTSGEEHATATSDIGSKG